MKEPMTDQQILDINAEALGFARRWVHDRDINDAKANICSTIQNLAVVFGLEHGFKEAMMLLAQASQYVVRDFANAGVTEAVELIESYEQALRERMK